MTRESRMITAKRLSHGFITHLGIVTLSGRGVVCGYGGGEGGGSI